MTEMRSMRLHPFEENLILYMREVQFAEITIRIRHGLPEYGEKVVQKIKFNIDTK